FCKGLDKMDSFSGVPADMLGYLQGTQQTLPDRLVIGDFSKVAHQITHGKLQPDQIAVTSLELKERRA
ncbi:MAG: hypothetical protein ACKO43_04925, partial [Alphaproteobacteria bacterium]